MKRRTTISLPALGLSIIAVAAAYPAVGAAAAGPAVPAVAYNNDVTAPSADHSYTIVSAGRDSLLLQIEKGTGELARSKQIAGEIGLPSVAQSAAGGLSADGGTLVLVRPSPRLNVRETEFAIVDTDRLKVEELTLDGAYSFDAISPDGRWMYLTKYPDAQNPYDYSVRAFDLERERFQRRPIVDPSEPDEAMTGLPFGRVMSPDGRWAYTLYAGGEETFVHALDTVGHTAVCIDVPQIEDVRNFYMLGLEPSDPAGLVVLHRGNPAALVDTETFEVTEPETDAEAGGSATDDSGGAPWLAIGGGALALAALAAVGIRRRRRAAVGSEQLEALVRVDDEDRDAGIEAREKERDPVP